MVGNAHPTLLLVFLKFDLLDRQRSLFLITREAQCLLRQRLRLANKGYPVEGERGDQLVEIQIVVPPEPTEEEKELYKKLQEIQSFDPRDSLLK